MKYANQRKFRFRAERRQRAALSRRDYRKAKHSLIARLYQECLDENIRELREFREYWHDVMGDEYYDADV